MNHQPPTIQNEQRIRELADRIEDILAEAQCPQRISDIETVLVTLRASPDERGKLARRFGVTIAKMENILGI